MDKPRTYPTAIANRKAHDQILFHLAYPSNKKELEEARLSISRFSQEKIEHPYSQHSAGLRGSVITGSFSFALVSWLNNRFPQDIEIESSAADAELVRLLFRQILPRCEYDTISVGEMDLLRRIQLLKGNTPGSMLNWLLEQIAAADITEQAKETVFHSLQIFIRCTITDPLLNVSMLKGPACPSGFHRVIKKKVSIKSTSRKKLPSPKQLSLHEKQNLIDTARASLFFLYRETEPFTYADPHELVYFELEKGLGIALYGMIPERRLSIESYIGYLAFSNGIPVAYGGGWLFGKRSQFGINILPAFRGGPSALLLAQLIRVYHQYYQAEKFVVKPYQFGEKNPEAIKTGAFWFYYKAGFRPELPEIHEMAKTEWLKIKKDRSYRTDAKTLRVFTKSAIYLDLHKDAFPDFDAAVISRRITEGIKENFQGDRKKAVLQSVAYLKKHCRGIAFKVKGGIMQKVFEEWSLVAMMSFEMNTWTRKEKEGFLELIKLKAQTEERKFILKLGEFTAENRRTGSFR